MNKEQQDKNWRELSEDGKQSRIASYQELLKLQKEGKDSYLITIEDLEKLYGSHNLNPKPLTYEDVTRELFLDKGYWIYSSANNNIQRDVSPINRAINGTSREQIEKLLAINKLLNVAKFLNGDWKPDWKNTEEKKWGILIQRACVGDGFDRKEGQINIVSFIDFIHTICVFRTKELAKQAIQILGEKTIRLALTTNY